MGKSAVQCSAVYMGEDSVTLVKVKGMVMELELRLVEGLAGALRG